MVTGIVVTHGMLAEELLSTAKRIFGEFSDCYPVSNIAKSPQALTDDLAALVEACEGKPCVVFVDFFGGSCSYACLRLLGIHKNVQVITGINLPMLLAFLNKREEIPFERLADEVIERGKSSIQILKRENL
ncbi:MAG: hypothetical protein GTN64_06705 [Candidatus Latescibacteria bacterium]|nr:hypothetical protein [Candidatus Latescibacterota bacterium]NIO78298.1 hypothetical protein [Candidatus Latescibacterota bacterium]